MSRFVGELEDLEFFEHEEDGEDEGENKFAEDEYGTGITLYDEEGYELDPDTGERATDVPIIDPESGLALE